MEIDPGLQGDDSVALRRRAGVRHARGRDDGAALDPPDGGDAPSGRGWTWGSSVGVLLKVPHVVVCGYRLSRDG
jgi:hypothetical protein